MQVLKNVQMRGARHPKEGTLASAGADLDPCWIKQLSSLHGSLMQATVCYGGWRRTCEYVATTRDEGNTVRHTLRPCAGRWVFFSSLLTAPLDSSDSTIVAVVVHPPGPANVPSVGLIEGPSGAALLLAGAPPFRYQSPVIGFMLTRLQASFPRLA